MDAELPEHVRRNRAVWDRWAAGYAAWAPRAWAATEPTWGLFSVPDAALGVLPASVAGLDVVELGCGTAYVSAWLARRGARPVGIDNSPKQLATARRLQAEFGLDFPLHLGNAERTPFADASFDLAVSEYGASIWCDPYKWIPEAARLLRAGGELVFLRNSTLAILCAADDETTSETLQRPQRGLHRLDWPDGMSEFHLGHGEWVRLLDASGLELVALVELYADERTPDHTYYAFSRAWAERWPWEEIWRARKR